MAALAVGLAVVTFSLAATLGENTANGALLGAGPTANPVLLLGTELGETGCPSTPLDIGKGRTVTCPGWTAVILPSGLVQVVSLYGPGNETVDTYRGDLPQGLHWGDSVTEITAALGQPQRLSGAFQTPTLVYMYRGLPYGSLELRLSLGGRLQRINACLKR